MTRHADETGWEAGWDGHQLAQQRRQAALPLWEKLAWLEDAQRLAAQLQSGTREASTSDQDPAAHGQGGGPQSDGH